MNFSLNNILQLHYAEARKFILDVEALRPNRDQNRYSKATETPLEADSPRLGTITSSLGDPSS